VSSIRKRRLPSCKTVWQVDYRDQAGRRRHRQFPTRRAADAWLVTARAEVAEGTHVPASESRKFADVADAWIEDCKRRGLERATVDVYEQRLRDYGKVCIGDRRIGELTTADVTQFYEDVLDRSCSHEIVRRVRIEAGAVIRYAQKKGWIVKNAFALTPYEGGKRKKRRPMMPTLQEVRLMIRQVTEHWPDFCAMFYVLIFCGLRSSELRALSWRDIDFGTSTMTVRQRADRWGRIGQPKSDAGTRDILFPEIVSKELKKWRTRCPKSALDLVFPSSRGTVANHANIMNRFLRLMQIEAGILVKKEVVGKDGKKLVKVAAK
jgi:integrase